MSAAYNATVKRIDTAEEYLRNYGHKLSAKGLEKKRAAIAKMKATLQEKAWAADDAERNEQYAAQERKVAEKHHAIQRGLETKAKNTAAAAAAKAARPAPTAEEKEAKKTRRKARKAEEAARSPRVTRSKAAAAQGGRHRTRRRHR